MMDLYVKLGTIEEALMTFNGIHSPNVVSYTTLISGFVKERMFEKAREVFDSMPDNEKNIVSWNTMIVGYGRAGRNEDVVNLFVEMLRRGTVPSEYTYPCVAIAAANIGALGVGRSVHACAVKFSGNRPGLYLSNSLVSFYAKCGCMDDSLLAFRKNPDRNVVSWNALICGYAQNGRGTDAIAAYEEMNRTGSVVVEPNSVTLLGLLWACTHVGKVDDGYKYFNEARSKRPEILEPEHYACMIDLLSRSGKFLEAEKFLDDLPFDPGVGFWKALLGGCRVHSNTALGEIAATRIVELDPDDVSSYVMLSNAHSAAGKWESVVKIRKKMKEKGLRRIPGSSWVEIGTKVHVFVTGDVRHEEKDEIYRVLRLFLEHVRVTNSLVRDDLVI
ncbi:pentatricopeptide repeat-containing protein At5g42450, mitochondrial-like isoform X2 [Andrographis paniculata]|nr:pentatricopeptide repeat-containing protein At5g42450, mitochondrial-like isoform X2 [Andrographis paniculata]